MIKLYRCVAFLSVTPLICWYLFLIKTVIIRRVSSFPHMPRPPQCYKISPKFIPSPEIHLVSPNFVIRTSIIIFSIVPLDIPVMPIYIRFGGNVLLCCRKWSIIGTFSVAPFSFPWRASWMFPNWYNRFLEMSRFSHLKLVLLEQYYQSYHITLHSSTAM